MKKQVYAIYDVDAQVYGNINFVHRLEEIQRTLINVVNDPDKGTDIAMNPESFQLWLIAEWDDNSGDMIPVKEK